MKVLILGVNGFIGHHLTNRILETTDWSVFGMDLGDDRLGKALHNPRFHFLEGDIAINREWIEYHIKKCDVVIPLVAIATPKLYVEDPIAVYNLDFEMNLEVVKKCVKYRKRIVFPSTSEVYGACPDAEFDEDESFLCVGPIRKERWIYSCCKQLLDRVIYAYGTRGYLDFTLFRPFNWIGPRLDSLDTAKEGSSRVVTQFIAELLMKRPITLVDGGRQKRCFTYVDDGIDALMRILENRGNRCRNEIINIGNPDNECSVRELALMMREIFAGHPDHVGDGSFSEIVEVSAEIYYGKGYQDIYTRRPKIEKARRLLDWQPRVGLRESLERTIYSFLEENTAAAREMGRHST
ncbi:MAG TPA: bifunctional UDP-4-keto-pentose/UDP-xylose synthase [Syntrophales bacterium]|nr:bifunctional UDP-4-keto-pentose/UDP-xylose synthase [Syntrophales bacterium]HOM07643.1 bifunctional UDP-4-keto-pentose/UDP-xylose synthase [Syntrophales bacterium]HOO00320.1 bifunctional UDP-4-keto-pentose/UDP-xylose synthase [Syntrophales bacterium]HPC01216.1 bifunctional UDP-4-keto-pentose/UDP-xylose synthase [Syntrophales bacterium]HPQ07215.1 bifunctional UDP-4-keto-pentose/UDP-xylose synthase [Syntrophales bacterium]